MVPRVSGSKENPHSLRPVEGRAGNFVEILNVFVGGGEVVNASVHMMRIKK